MKMMSSKKLGRRRDRISAQRYPQKSFPSLKNSGGVGPGDRGYGYAMSDLDSEANGADFQRLKKQASQSGKYVKGDIYIYDPQLKHTIFNAEAFNQNPRNQVWAADPEVAKHGTIAEHVKKAVEVLQKPSSQIAVDHPYDRRVQIKNIAKAGYKILLEVRPPWMTRSSKRFLIWLSDLKAGNVNPETKLYRARAGKSEMVGAIEELKTQVKQIAHAAKSKTKRDLEFAYPGARDARTKA